ncbi:MAG: GtrA family protein [Chromatiaceae bacterium]
MIRYLFVGGTAALLDWSLFWLLAVVLGIHYLLAACMSFIAATLLNYVLSILHVFESKARFSRNHEVALVFVVSAIGLAINQLAMLVLVGYLSFNLLLSKIAASGIVFGWNYSARAHFVFKPSRLEP